MKWLKSLIKWWRYLYQGCHEAGKDFHPCKTCGHHPVCKIDFLNTLFVCRTWCDHCGYELLSQKTARGFGETQVEAIKKSRHEWNIKQKEN